MSEARTHRKAAQGPATTVVEKLKGVSGLSTSAKASRLNEALSAAKSVVASLEKAVGASSGTFGGSSNARKYRKEVQSHVAKATGLAKGVSGLSSSAKKARLAELAEVTAKAAEAAKKALQA